MESLKLLILKLMTNTYYFLFISVTGRAAWLKSKKPQARRTVFVLFFKNIKFSYLIGNNKLLNVKRFPILLSFF